MREPGANPGRSRRCKGSCSPTETPLATGRPAAGKAVGEGAPSQKTCRLLHTEPLVEGGFVARRSIVLVAVFGLALALAATTLGATVTVRVEGKTQPIFGSVPVKVDAPNALVALDVASTLGEFYFQADAVVVRHVREPDRPLPGRRLCRLGVQGQRCLAAGRCRPGRAEGRRRGALVLRHVRCHRWAADARRSRRRRRTATRSRPSTTRASRRPPPGRRFSSTAGGSRPGSNGRACVGKHVGLVRAYAVGAVRSNAVK